MTNLIGAEANDYGQAGSTMPGAAVHLYGKGEPAPGPQDGPCDEGVSLSRHFRAATRDAVPAP